MIKYVNLARSLLSLIVLVALVGFTAGFAYGLMKQMFDVGFTLFS